MLGDTEYVVKFSNGLYYEGGYTSGAGTKDVRYAKKYSFEWQPLKDLYLQMSAEQNNLTYELEKVRTKYEFVDERSPLEQETTFELRGDEQHIIEEIKKYIPIEREDIWSWLCYFQNELPQK